jgi:seryl-tRNA synthetase
LLQCCTGDLGPKNADMIDIECWMPGRGADGPDGRPVGAYGETHSASRLYDYQCRRLNMRYREEVSASLEGRGSGGGSSASSGTDVATPTHPLAPSLKGGGKGAIAICHSLNNTVLASPRILIPIIEMYQEADGSVNVPAPLRPYMQGIDRIGI